MRRAERALPIRHAVALGLLQGPTELLPVSSSAHTTLVPWLAGWDYDELDDEVRKAFEVALHCGTAAALALLAGRELVADAGHVWRTRPPALVLALAPPALAGLLLGPLIEKHLGGPLSIALALTAGSAGMLAAERSTAAGGGRAAGPGRGLGDARALDGLVLGLAQAAALIPGVSRSGATISVARGRGFARADAYRLSWTVALPVMAGAGMLQGWRLRRRAVTAGVRPALAAGTGAAFCSTLAGGWLLRGRLRDWPLTPFAFYRGALAGAVVMRVCARR
jgi:undecaprenyl-diphosphatase